MREEHQRPPVVHKLLRAVIMMGFTWFIVRLVQSGDLIYYIAPRMEIYIKYAAIGLFVIAVFQVYTAVQSMFERDGEEACDCDHTPPRSFLMNVMTYGLFALPLLLGFLMPDTAMGSSIAAMKGMNLNSAGSVRTAAAAAPAATVPAGGANTALPAAVPAASKESKLQALFPSDIYTADLASLGMKLYGKADIPIKEEGFIEVLTTVDMYRDNFLGKQMEISGFVYREDGMKGNQFVLARLAMQCCSADAAPYGILIEADTASKYKKDSWVSLKGTIGKTTYKGKEILKLDVGHIDTIATPKSPYVYPYLDDLVKLAD